MPAKINWKSRKTQTKLCPRCWHFMDYKKLPNRIQKWAPFEYGWTCQKCSNIFWLDGSIKPRDNTWEKRYQLRQRKIMFATIRVFAFDIRKNNAQIKKRQGDESLALGSSDDEKSRNETDRQLK